MYSFGETVGRGQEYRGRVHIVLCLRQHVSGNMARIGIVGDDHDLGWAGYKVDSHFASQKLLRGGDVDISRTNDAVHSRNGGRAERERCDSLSAADAKHIWYVQQPG